MALTRAWRTDTRGCNVCTMSSPIDDGCFDNELEASDFEELASGDEVSDDGEGEDTVDDTVDVIKSCHSSPKRDDDIVSSSLERKTTPKVLSAYIPCPFGVFPPVIRWSYDGDDDEYTVAKMNKEERQGLRWRYTSTTGNLVKNMLKRIGFKPSSTKYGWIGQWGGHMKLSAFRKLMPHQKVNHLPGSFCLGRKDSLWKNIVAMRSKHGKPEWSFLPECFLLPREKHKLKATFTSAPGNKWILKPYASARGIGIRVVDKWGDIPKTKRTLVQRYVHNPALINGSKYDLRVYVYVTSYDPLRIYICRDGLVRIATRKYSMKKSGTSDRYVHLTNYSVNCKSKDFIANEDSTAQTGHKWSIKTLMKHFEETGVDGKKVWERIDAVVLKTLLAADGKINSSIKLSTCRRSVCHEVFGFDIMLDSKLQPNLIEVNISPSMHSQSRLDRDVKGRMLRDVFNLSGYRKAPKQPTQNDKMEGIASDAVGSNTGNDVLDVANGGLTVEERTKHAYFTRHQDRCESILDHLTDDDYKILMETESENSRRGDMVRIFPSAKSHKILKYTDNFRYYNMLLEQWNKRFGYDVDGTMAINYLKMVADNRKTANRRGSFSTIGTPQFESNHSIRFDSGMQQFNLVPHLKLPRSSPHPPRSRKPSESNTSPARKYKRIQSATVRGKEHSDDRRKARIRSAAPDRMEARTSTLNKAAEYETDDSEFESHSNGSSPIKPQQRQSISQVSSRPFAIVVDPLHDEYSGMSHPQMTPHRIQPFNAKGLHRPPKAMSEHHSKQSSQQKVDKGFNVGSLVDAQSSRSKRDLLAEAAARLSLSSGYQFGQADRNGTEIGSLIKLNTPSPDLQRLEDATDSDAISAISVRSVDTMMSSNSRIRDSDSEDEVDSMIITRVVSRRSSKTLDQRELRRRGSSGSGLLPRLSAGS